MTADDLKEELFPDIELTDGGISSRDYFAAKAMQALIADGWYKGGDAEKSIAIHAHKIADAMLEYRKL